MSTIRVRAIVPVTYGPKAISYEAGADWEADEELIRPLLELGGQVEEVKEPSLLVVPTMGLFLPTEPSAEPAIERPTKNRN
jgi:hypothetical protein